MDLHMIDNQENIHYTIEEIPNEPEPEPEPEPLTVNESVCENINPDLISLCMNCPTKHRELNKVPKFVFIVPYRDRKHSLDNFNSQMKMVLEDTPPEDYEIYFSHQCDTRDFNRGAMKNIGFLVIKNKYPTDYKNITFVFNDVDTTPVHKNLINYPTTVGTIKHFYGFTYTLGGIVSITGEDFEKINGYLNLWSWGYEDNSLQKRAINSNIHIDRSKFFSINSKEINQEQHGNYRIVNKEDFNSYLDNNNDGINSIFNINYEITEDNFINVYNFTTGRNETPEKNLNFDISKSKTPFEIKPKNRNNRFRMMI